MAREKMFDPAYQKCFTEAIHKENEIRRNWHLQYSSQSKKSDAINWDEDPSDDDGDADHERDLISRASKQWPMPPKEERAWPASFAPATRTIPRVTRPPIVMKPVDKPARQILYQGLSHDGEGRSQYLRFRTRKSPEEKYYFPMCSSWEYGWKYGIDDTEYLECPRHGRRRA